MPFSRPIENIDIPDAGATLTLDGSRYVERYLVNLTGTGTLSGNVSITGDVFTSAKDIYVVEFPGGVTLGANTCTIFGKSLTASQALNPCLIVARYTGSAYVTQIYTDWSANNTVTTAHINDNAITTAKVLDAAVTLAKWADLNRGNVIRGDSSNRPEAYDLAAIGAGAILSTDATDVLGQLLSQDITTNGALVATIANNAVTTAKILDATITLAKLQAIQRGRIIRGNSSNRPEEYNVAGIGAGALVMTDGTDVLAQLLSGDGLIDGAGALTISVGLNTYITKVTIPTASVLTANSIPINLVGAPGAGKIIRPIACINTLTFNSVAYATNGDLQLRHNTATDPCMQAGNVFLFGSVTHTSLMTQPAINAVTDTQFLANQALLWEVATGDPTAGDSDVVCYLIYQIVDV